MMQKEQPQAWWFDSHNLARPSPWLGNTLSELDDKTKQMLKLIDQDADSFAQRAEMYYKKRPVLVDMLGDLYRAHRSLAEQCDLLKHGGGTRRSTVFASPSPCNKSWSPAASMDGKAGAGSSSSSTSLCSGSSYDSESEVDDPEEEDHHHGDHQKVHHHHHHGDHQKVSEGETEAEKKKKKKEQQPEQQQEAAELMEEIRRLKEQNSELQKAMEESTAMFKAELAAKDEEKREVIRQLAASLDVVQGENSTLRECIKSSNHHHRRPAAARAFDLRKLTRDLFSAKLFTAHCKPSGPVVAL